MSPIPTVEAENKTPGDAGHARGPAGARRQPRGPGPGPRAPGQAPDAVPVGPGPGAPGPLGPRQRETQDRTRGIDPMWPQAWNRTPGLEANRVVRPILDGDGPEDVMFFEG